MTDADKVKRWRELGFEAVTCPLSEFPAKRAELFALDRELREKGLIPRGPEGN